jgi:hypothetical protein
MDPAPKWKPVWGWFFDFNLFGGVKNALVLGIGKRNIVIKEPPVP